MLAVALGVVLAVLAVATGEQAAPVTGVEPPAASFAARRAQAESLSARGRRQEALRAFLAARRLAPTADDAAYVWFRIAGEYGRLGEFTQALDAYARQQALAAPDPISLGNSAELLMALGQLDESVRAYREALAIEERARDRRAHLYGLALGYLGLGAALDRGGHPEAAREAIARGLSLDPGLGVLRLVEQGGGDGGVDLSVLPPEDASYYLALAREVQGRRADAAVAFRAYLDAAVRRGKGNAVVARYVERALAHLSTLEAQVPRPNPTEAPAETPPGDGRGLRVVRTATLEARGPLVAPMIDAAWRLDPALLDACLADVSLASVAGTEGTMPRADHDFRMRLELVIDGNGRVSSASIEAPAALPAGVAPCIVTALENRLRVPRPARKRSTRARVEVVLAPVEPSGV